MAPAAPRPTLKSLWAQFLPLSMSDVSMAAGDPAVTSTLAYMPGAIENLAAVGVARSLAVFFESPIIMLLHTSNALAPSMASRRALWRFVLIAIAVLSGGMLLLSLPPVFDLVGARFMGIAPGLLERSRWTIGLLILWPAMIGWRRYHQGLLIFNGHPQAVANAGFARLGTIAGILALGFIGRWPGWALAGIAMIVALFVETALVTWAAHRSGSMAIGPGVPSPDLPEDLVGIWRFYWPLANSMLVLWGGRALLLAVVARAADGAIALAAWPAAWGFVVLIANGTRMIQQVVIKNRMAPGDPLVWSFTAGVGVAFTGILLVVGFGPFSKLTLGAFVGQDSALLASVMPVVRLCVCLPIVIAFQNALQGLLIAKGRTRWINVATWVSTAVMLLGAWGAIALGQKGAIAAAIAMVGAMVLEMVLLAVGLRSGPAPSGPVSTAAPRREAVGAGTPR